MEANRGLRAADIRRGHRTLGNACIIREDECGLCYAFVEKTIDAYGHYCDLDDMVHAAKAVQQELEMRAGVLSISTDAIVYDTGA